MINRNYEVLHFAGPTEDYLVQPGGPPTQNLLSLARKQLEPKLRVAHPPGHPRKRPPEHQRRDHAP